ncbi:MAG: 2-phospho-L-lactate guanylyltransferase [Jiangellaceae bacterium]|nr:2-phospho-L-lactate guanylyltransferase [Jiangellaceae bacterium]
MNAPDDPAAWSVIVPVKRPEVAKTRLSNAAGPQRAAMARAFAADTVAAALGCTEVAEVVVVTDDAATARDLGAFGAFVVADSPEAGLNAALHHGAKTAGQRRPGAPRAALSADLPALRSAELDLALRAARAHRSAFVCDAAGIGTTLYCVTSGAFEPRFGGRSRAAHRKAGVVELDLVGIASVRRDVDTAVDLWDALRLGVGERTAAVVASLGVAQGA